MKRKIWTVLLTALLVLSCIVVFAACGPSADSGDNGDDTPIVTPGDPDDDPDAPHEHTYTSEVTREPSCEQEGETTYTCTCGDSYTESIPITAHIEVIDEAVAPTCTKTGLTEGKHCSVCGTVLVEQEVVPMTAHNYIDGFCDACGAEREPTEGLEFELSDDGTQYAVTDYTGTATQVYIPSVYEGLPVTSISGYAFSSAAYIDEIIISASLTWIEPFAFEGCRSLTSFTVSEDSLSYCVIDDILFSEDQRTLICYPAKKEGATYQIPNGVEAVFNSAFEGTQNLSHVTIPDSVTVLATYAFSDSSLTSVIIGNGIEEILLSVFENCTNLKNVQFGSGLIRIWDSTFRFCSNLESIVFPEGVTSIGNGVFMNCTKLVNITIPDSVTSIGQHAFEGTAYYKDEANWENGILYVGNHVIKADYDVESPPPIREGTKTIADFAFSDCSHLIGILIPNSVTSIGNSAFEDCTQLDFMIIPDSIKNIGSDAFKDTAYYNDESNWENGALYLENYLIDVQEALAGAYTIRDGTTLIACSAFSGCSNLTSIFIPDGVTCIGDSAFFGCSGLTSITVPDSVTSIGNYAFSDCESLTSITVGDSRNLASIGWGAFSGCSSLTSITIPDSVTSIEDVSFAGCVRLASITIPDSVTSIGYAAFSDCSSLTSVTFEDPEGWYRTINIGAASGTDLASEDLSDPSTAAEYLTDTYGDCYWYKR